MVRKDTKFFSNGAIFKIFIFKISETFKTYKNNEKKTNNIENHSCNHNYN